jgi:protein-tyrosine-phosphatase
LEPVSEIHPAAVAAMAATGIHVTTEFSKPRTVDFLDAADVVVTMGCGDACALMPGKHHGDWELPPGRTIEEIRPIRDQVPRHVDQQPEPLGILTA